MAGGNIEILGSIKLEPKRPHHADAEGKHPVQLRHVRCGEDQAGGHHGGKACGQQCKKSVASFNRPKQVNLSLAVNVYIHIYIYVGIHNTQNVEARLGPSLPPALSREGSYCTLLKFGKKPTKVKAAVRQVCH